LISLYKTEITVSRKVTNGAGYRVVYIPEEIWEEASVKLGDKVIITNKTVEGKTGVFIFKR
jgi:bifunctional DNA-binding transcriptional regulator/antitoxin component of YhaV-PrlF toxin-antitoxin module